MSVASQVEPQDVLAPSVERRRIDWRWLALGLLILVLVYQVVVPFIMIVWTSFKTVGPGETGFLSLHFSLANYIRAYGTHEFWKSTSNTLYFSLASTVLSFILGTFLSWVVERTNTPLARLIGTTTLARIIIPGILIAISWIYVASPSIGFLTYVIKQTTGVSHALNIYTFWGMVWVHGLEMVPLAYLLIAAAFQAMDPRLEEASTMTGAGMLRTLRRVSLPLIMPAILASMILLFITAAETFEVPLLLGGRAGVNVFTTEVYFATARTPVDWGLSSTYSIALVTLSIVLLGVYFTLLRHGERYQTITGKDFRPRRLDLGPWKYVTCAASLLLVFLITGLPFIIMLYASFLPAYVGITPQPLSVLSLENFRELLSGGLQAYALQPMLNSTLLGLGSATAVMIVAAAIAYFVHKTRIRGRKALDFLAFASIAIPSVVLGTAFMWFYLLVPVPILGTLTIIGLAYLTKYLPYALRFVSSSMLQIHSELEEAAEVAGIPWWKNFFRIYLPLLKPGLMAGWFWVMVHAYRELTIALLLARSNNRTASVIIYDSWQNGSFQQISAFGVLMFVSLIILVAISRIISARYGIKEQM